MRRSPAPRGRAAVAAWPERLVTVRREPTEENLQRLCNLLDSVDRWVVEAWDKPTRDERRAVLDRMRAEARDAQALVTATSRKRQTLQGQAAVAIRMRTGTEASVASPAGLGAPVGGDAA